MCLCLMIVKKSEYNLLITSSHQPLIHIYQRIDPIDQAVSSPAFESKTAYPPRPVFSDDATSL